MQSTPNRRSLASRGNQNRLTTRGIVDRQYCQKHPMMATRALGLLMYNENQPLFRSREDARQILNYYRGAVGKKCRRCSMNKSWFSEAALAKLSTDIPAPVRDSWAPYIVSPNSGRILVIADVHVPFHERVPIAAAVRKGLEDECDTIILNGDVWDCYEGSPFLRDPRKRDFLREVTKVQQFFDMLRKYFPDAKIIYKGANHEERWRRLCDHSVPSLVEVLHKQGREKDDSNPLTVPGLLQLHNWNVTYVDDRRRICVGMLNILHADEFSRGAYVPVSPARTALLKTRANIMVAHHHQTSMAVHSSIDGPQLVGHSIGCMCNLHPYWLRVNDWNWGFARINKYAGRGGFKISNYRVSKRGELW